MDTEPPSNFRSIFAKFEDASCSTTQPANPPPALNISNVRSNPALADVISALENKPNYPPAPISKKPGLPTKPSAAVLQRETSGNRLPVTSKEKLSSAKDMRLNKGLRHTLYMVDSPRSDGDGVCSQSPQVYRQSWPAVLDPKHPPGLDANQSDHQDCYEVIDDFNTKENPPLSFRGPLKSQTSNVSRQHSAHALETNLSDNADCYEDVDNVKANAKPPIPYMVQLKSKVVSFSEEKPSPMMEASQSDGPGCYEFIDDSLNTPILPPSPFTAPSSFSKPKALPGSEMSQSDGQGCYEEVDSTFHTLAERPPPFGGNSKPRVSFTYPEPPDIAELHELDGQGQYEPVDSIFDLHIEPPPPFNDPPIPQKNLPPIKPKSKPFRSVETNDKTTLSDRSPDKEDKPPRPPDAKSKPKKNIPVISTPRKKPLPSIPCGLPPPKEPRPPQVDLTAYRSAALPYKVVHKTPRGEAAETEYELPAPSSPAHEEDLYDDTMNLGPSQEDESNVYEVEEGLLSETPKVQESRKSISSPSPEEGCECYEDILNHQEPEPESNAYEVEESGFAPAPEPAGENCYEVSEENKDSWASRDQNGSYPGFRSSVSDGFCSTRDLDSNRGTLPRDGKISKVEQTFRKKFKITGLEDTLYTTTIILDFKPEKNTLPLKRGDVVDVIRITDCPPGKWLVKDNQENHGFVPVSCVDISKDILTFSNQHLLINSGSSDIYAEVDRTCDSGVGTDLSISDSYSVKSDDAYDDIDSSKRSTLSNSGGKPKGFANLFRKDKSSKEDSWSPSATLNSNAASEEGGENHSNGSSESNAREKEDKSSTIFRSLFHKGKEQKGKTDSPKNEGKVNTQAKKLAKEEKIFREKFKYNGEISVYSIATINASVPLSLRDKMALHVKLGEIVDVIDVTNEDQIICRNAEGKYGFVRIDYLNFQPKY